MRYLYIDKYEMKMKIKFAALLYNWHLNLHAAHTVLVVQRKNNGLNNERKSCFYEMKVKTAALLYKQRFDLQATL